MRHAVRFGFAALAFCMVAASPALAESSIAVDGQVGNPRQWTLAELQQLPPVTVRVTNATDHGDVEAVYTGALLWTVIDQSTPIDGPGHGAFLRRAVLVTGRDGYAVVLASGEIDPDFEGKQVIIAYATGGKPNTPDQGVKLIVPGDRHGDRNVRDIGRITVNSLGEQGSKPLPGPTPAPPGVHFPP